MKAVVQRVKQAKVEVDGEKVANIGQGIVVLLGITESDNTVIIDWFTNKLINLRIFEDSSNKMNLSVKEINGEILLIPNFTIYGETKKGFRPSYTSAAKSEISEPIFHQLYHKLSGQLVNKVQIGVFGANMEVSLVNDGPVTLIIEKE